MQTVTEFFGFTDLVSTLWNGAAYLAFVGIIIGVLSERYRNLLITAGAAVLALYAEIFFHNRLFAVLQALIVISGVLSMADIVKRRAMMTMSVLTVGAYAILVVNGAINDMWSLTGSFGLLGIAFGLIILPKRYGYLLMAFGGALLVAYAYTVDARVFFLLNILFLTVNIRSWLRQR